MKMFFKGLKGMIVVMIVWIFINSIIVSKVKAETFLERLKKADVNQIQVEKIIKINTSELPVKIRPLINYYGLFYRWSLDGEKIGVMTADGFAEMNADGSDRKITGTDFPEEGWRVETWECNLDKFSSFERVSPDGTKRIFYENDSYCFEDLNSHEVEVFTDEIVYGPWSYDSKNIVYSNSSTDYKVTFYNIETKEIRRTDIEGGGFQWAPDNTKIALWTQQKAHILDVASLKLQELDIDSIGMPFKIGEGNTVNWSPDSRKIVYIDYGEGNYMPGDAEGYPPAFTTDLWITDIEGKQSKKLIGELAVDNISSKYHVSWSPDGKKIAYLEWIQEIETLDILEGNFYIIFLEIED